MPTVKKFIDTSNDDLWDADLVSYVIPHGLDITPNAIRMPNIMYPINQNPNQNPCWVISCWAGSENIYITCSTPVKDVTGTVNIPGSYIFLEYEDTVVTP